MQLNPSKYKCPGCSARSYSILASKLTNDPLAVRGRGNRSVRSYLSVRWQTHILFVYFYFLRLMNNSISENFSWKKICNLLFFSKLKLKLNWISAKQCVFFQKKKKHLNNLIKKFRKIYFRNQFHNLFSKESQVP